MESVGAALPLGPKVEMLHTLEVDEESTISGRSSPADDALGSTSPSSSGFLQIEHGEATPVAHFARRPSVGTWLQPAPVSVLEGEPLSDFDRMMTFICPWWPRVHHNLELEEESSVVDPCEADEGGIEAEVLEVELMEATAAEELADYNADSFDELFRHAAEIVANLKALSESFKELLAESLKLQCQHGTAVLEQRRLGERLERLRFLLRRVKGVAQEQPRAAEPWQPKPTASPGLPKYRRLPEMIARALSFDQDQDGLGTAPLKELSSEAAELSEYYSELVQEFQAFDDETVELRRVCGGVLEENRMLEHRISHLRTCLQAAKAREAAKGAPGPGAPSPAASPGAELPQAEKQARAPGGRPTSRLSRGGC